MSEKVKITVKPNGSIRVEGDFELNYTKQGETEVTTEVVDASAKSLSLWPFQGKAILRWIT